MSILHYWYAWKSPRQFIIYLCQRVVANQEWAMSHVTDHVIVDKESHVHDFLKNEGNDWLS